MCGQTTGRNGLGAAFECKLYRNKWNVCVTMSLNCHRNLVEPTDWHRMGSPVDFRSM